MNLRYHVELSEAERCELNGLLSGGKHSARKLKRAQILLAADAGVSDEAIEAGVAVGGSTVYRTKRRFVEERAGGGAVGSAAAGRRAQAHRQGGSAPDRHRLFEPAAWPRPLDAGTACRRDGQPHRT